ncbi:hypothetical protein SAMN05421740_10562 [Parapedobacter koreensis]|uniref:Uncharacterized protein n=1 Tax=Parapedobacter koreensis TaxID=332977 RepID=A0A1H7PXF7_9SPHI|nr:hypothetical protein SAMN05421740_10562 [Parapedobacter koreensis]
MAELNTGRKPQSRIDLMAGLMKLRRITRKNILYFLLATFLTGSAKLIAQPTEANQHAEEIFRQYADSTC